jgi:hypothetical protein
MRPVLTLFVAAVATAAFAVGFLYRQFPLGVPGQFEHPRLGPWDLPVTPWFALLPAAIAALAMIALVVWSVRWIDTAGRRTFFLILIATLLSGGAFQVLLEIASPGGLGKWATLYHGFRRAARTEFTDVSSALTDHAQVAAAFEPNHVSANPAGWIVVFRALLSFFDNHPTLAEAVWKIEPDELAWSLRNQANTGGTPLADQAAVTTVAYLNRCAALLVGLPVAWLVRQRYSRSAALVAVAMSMFVPAAALLAPSVDSVYPSFATLIVAMSYYASVNRSWPAAAGAGVLIGIGMLFSLSFLVVAAMCALLVVVRAVQGHRPSPAAVVAAPAAWCLVLGLMAAAFGHRAWESWLVNLQKNHEFNEYSGCSYWVWVLVNLAEFAVAMGISAATFLSARIVAGARAPRTWRSADAVCLAWTATMALLALAGTNRGEASRLWLFLMPLAAMLSVESMVLSARHIRAVVAAALALQTMNGLIVSRELVMLWQWLPHDAAQEFIGENNRQWSSWRRLSDEELQRRTGKLPAEAEAGADDNAIRAGQTVYLWSAREKMVGVAGDADAYARLTRAAEEHDTSALDALSGAGRATLLPQNTKAMVVKRGKVTHVVRILGDSAGRTLHVGVDDVHWKPKR